MKWLRLIGVILWVDKCMQCGASSGYPRFLARVRGFLHACTLISNGPVICPHTASALALVKPFTTDMQENNFVVDTGEIRVELSNPEKMKFVYKILLIAHIL